MLATIISLVYIGGLVLTTVSKADEEIDLNDAAFMTTAQFLSGRTAFFLMLKGILAGALWPMYWTGRLLYVPAERLLLPPGDTL